MVLLAFYGTSKEAAEEGLILGESDKKHTSVAKATAFSIGFIPGINPRPTARVRFSASCKAVPFQNSRTVRVFPLRLRD